MRVYYSHIIWIPTYQSAINKLWRCSIIDWAWSGSVKNNIILTARYISSALYKSYNENNNNKDDIIIICSCVCVRSETRLITYKYCRPLANLLLNRLSKFQPKSGRQPSWILFVAVRCHISIIVIYILLSVWVVPCLSNVI